MSRELNSIQKQITYASTSSTYVGSIPMNAYIVDIVIPVKTAFNATGDDKIYVGTSSDAGKYVDGASVNSAGFATVTKTSDAAGILSTSEQTLIYAQYVPGSTDATAGSAQVCITYAYND
jgi:hypothetical protein